MPFSKPDSTDSMSCIPKFESSTMSAALTALGWISMQELVGRRLRAQTRLWRQPRQSAGYARSASRVRTPRSSTETERRVVTFLVLAIFDICSAWQIVKSLDRADGADRCWGLDRISRRCAVEVDSGGCLRLRHFGQ